MVGLLALAPMTGGISSKTAALVAKSGGLLFPGWLPVIKTFAAIGPFAAQCG
jgi:hypothetical protein